MMDIRDELTPTILKMRNLAETFLVYPQSRQGGSGKKIQTKGTYYLLNGLADEIETAMEACSGIKREVRHGQAAGSSLKL
jgi:hypothetical protein